MAEEKATPESEEQLDLGAQEQVEDDADLLEEKGEEVLPSSVEELQAKLGQAEQQLASQKDQVLRAQAELQNARRRAERDVENAHKYSLEKITQELLPVVDNLERALEASGSDSDFAKALREGVEMTLGMFTKALAKFQIEQVDPEGEPFDPQLHQAVSMVEQGEVEPNTVVHVMQKGYTLHGRLVRPAMVVVSKAAAKDAPKIDEQA